jgi:hypothetical protein
MGRGQSDRPQNIVDQTTRFNGNSTGVDFSTDGGSTGGLGPLVRRHHPSAPGGVWSDAYSDPAHALILGNLYYTALGSTSPRTDTTALRKSNSCLKGSALHTPGDGSCVPFVEPQGASAAVIRTNFSDPNLSDDKELMAIDTSPASPYLNSIYVTWTIFDFSGAGGGYVESPIYFAKSTDGGVTWTPAMIISGSSSTLCNFGDFFDPTKDPHACNFDQGSSPVVGPDGTIYVAFNNQNNSEDKQGAAWDRPAADGRSRPTEEQTWSEPTKIGARLRDAALSVPGNEIAGETARCFVSASPNNYRIDDFAALGSTRRRAICGFLVDFRNGGLAPSIRRSVCRWSHASTTTTMSSRPCPATEGTRGDPRSW